MVRQRGVAIGLVVLAAVAWVWAWRRMGATHAPAAPETARVEAPADELPRIDLARLSAPRGGTEAGQRDIFGFGPERDSTAAASAAAPPPPTTMTVATPAPEVVVAPQVPPLNVKYVGTLERKDGLRVAILLTDRQEVLTGQAGEMVANRFRIVKIGYESVDIQDVGSDRVRRIPYKGN